MLLLGDSLHILKDINDESIDLIVTDPPYGIEFMGKDWDKALVSVELWKECYRVLKQGKLAFVMCSPRQDVLSRMILSLGDAGFRTNYTSIYWTYASGFPKAANVSKLIDKRNGRTENEYKQLADYIRQKRLDRKYSMIQLGEYFKTNPDRINHGGCVSNWESAANIPTQEQYDILKDMLGLDNRFDELIEREEAEREIIGHDKRVFNYASFDFGREWDITKPATEEAKKMEGAYVGFQPKPALEVILCVSKGKTLTWLDDCRIPYQNEQDKEYTTKGNNRFIESKPEGYRNYGERYGYDKIVDPSDRQMPDQEKGRFPANLLVSDSVLDDGTVHKSGKMSAGIKRVNREGYTAQMPEYTLNETIGDSGGFSRYFSLDSWFSKTYPFLIVPKASKSEKNKGLSGLEKIKVNDGRNTPIDNPFQRGETLRTNTHPTSKPIKLMSYLITLGSRENDLVLDPFLGSGTTGIAAYNLHRKFIGIEINDEYLDIAKHRLMYYLNQRKLF